jgi:ribonuclease VapC
MFVDASAIVAILNEEDDADELMARLARHNGSFYVSPLTRFEACIALARVKRDPRKTKLASIALAEEAVGEFIVALRAEDIEISAEIGRGALEAAKSFGKCVGHAADLNFGDCFAYACAKAVGAPLLFKGDDFSRTDINDGFDPI